LSERQNNKNTNTATDAPNRNEVKEQLSADQLFDLPGPQPYEMGFTEVFNTEDTYKRAESLLELAHSATTQQSAKVVGVTALVSEESIQAFEETYADFQPVELWFYSPDDEVLEKVAKEGMAALDTEVLAQGVPVGMYRVEDVECEGPHKMILCKVALGRVLPSTDDAQESLSEETLLPTGYHSLHVRANVDVSPPTLAGDGTPAYFADTFLVPNTHLVLPTHVVSYDTWNSVVGTAPSFQIPELTDRLTVSQYLSQSRRGASIALEEQHIQREYRAVINGMDELVETYDTLEGQLEAFSESLEEFKERSHSRSEGFTTDLISFMDHYLHTTQTIDETAFAQSRFISDINRLQEYHCYQEETMPFWQFFNSWRHTNKIGDNTQGSLALLYDRPPLNQQAMALTEKNKKILGMRRELMHQDAVIERLMDRLRERGALLQEDEELAQTL